MLQLAQEGKGEALDVLVKDVKNEMSSDFLSVLPEDMLLYSFGKAATSGKGNL